MKWSGVSQAVLEGSLVGGIPRTLTRLPMLLGAAMTLLVAACDATGGVPKQRATAQLDAAMPLEPRDSSTLVDRVADAAAPTNAAIRGGVHKGPFLAGSAVRVSRVDAKGNSTGKVFTTETHNNRGDFRLEIGEVDQVLIQCTGFYFNEVLGRPSNATLTLRAFHQVSMTAPQATYLNVLTHLTSRRVKTLLEAGDPLPESLLRAEAELRTALGIGPKGYSPKAVGTAISGFQPNNQDSAYLLALSAVLLQAARLRGEATADAHLQDILDSLAEDLADDGTLAHHWAEELRAAERSLDVAAVGANLERRLRETGQPGNVPDIAQMIDTDGDGVVNALDDCVTIPNPGPAPCAGAERK